MIRAELEKQGLEVTEFALCGMRDDDYLTRVRTIEAMEAVKPTDVSALAEALDDLLFLGASISRYPLEGYREACGTNVTLGTRFASKPIELKIPVTIAGMYGFKQCHQLVTQCPGG